MSKLNDTNCTPVPEDVLIEFSEDIPKDVLDVPEDSIIIDSQCSQCPDNACYSFYNSQEDVTDGTSDVTVVLKDILEEEQIDTENDSEDYNDVTSDVTVVLKDIAEEEQIDSDTDIEDDIEDYNEDRIKDYIDEALKSENVSLFYSGLYTGEEVGVLTKTFEEHLQMLKKDSM